MRTNLTFIIFGLMMGIDFAGLVILIGILFIPCFFIFRKIYRKKFNDESSKVLRWSIVSSLLLAPILVVLFLGILIAWLLYDESH